MYNWRKGRGDVMKRAIESAYGFLKYSSPLKTDCGKLCGRQCCTQEDMGMLLFPGEEKLFENDEDFVIRKDAKGRNLLFCSGRCERKKRPISCRIYPLFPYTFESDGEIHQKVVYDLRGINSCEMISSHIKTQRSFFASVRKAGKSLLRDKECAGLLLDISREIDEIIKLNEDIGGLK